TIVAHVAFNKCSGIASNLYSSDDSEHVAPSTGKYGRPETHALGRLQSVGLTTLFWVERLLLNESAFRRNCQALTPSGYH
ncbi:MAG: hypothetical protein ACE5FM_08110, partial [Methyloligellaceae bacterium]